jgi:hypothetical protein
LVKRFRDIVKHSKTLEQIAAIHRTSWQALFAINSQLSFAQNIPAYVGANIGLFNTSNNNMLKMVELPRFQGPLLQGLAETALEFGGCVTEMTQHNFHPSEARTIELYAPSPASAQDSRVFL